MLRLEIDKAQILGEGEDYSLLAEKLVNTKNTSLQDRLERGVNVKQTTIIATRRRQPGFH